MNSLKNKILNLLLYPTQLFDKITDKRATLYAGILLVGAIDLFLPDVTIMLRHFSSKPVSDIYFNMAAGVLLVLVLGLIDVIFLSVPLYDFFKFIKRKEEATIASSSEEKIAVVPHIATPIKIMKIYIMSHFIIIPVQMVIYFLFLKHMTNSSPAWQLNLVLLFYMLIYIWGAAIITRGINTLFKFNLIFRKLTFIIVFGWSYLFEMVFEMQILQWLTKIFR